MSEDANPPEAEKSSVKPVEDNPAETVANKKPAAKEKKAKKKSAKRPEANSDAKADDAPKNPNEQKAAKQEDGKDSESKNSRRRSRGRGSKPAPKASSKHDPEQLANYAWKIYLAEVSEEGVTMIDDAAAKALSRRCFELAAAFLDERDRQS